MPSTDTRRKLAFKDYVHALSSVGRAAFKAAPLAVVIKIIGSIITAVLPIVITYFAALTTTELALAFTGDPNAGRQALTYVVITSVLGIFQLAWSSIETYIDELTRFKVDVVISDQLYQQFLNLDFWRYDDKKTADLFDRARQFSQYFNYIFSRLTGIVTQLISMIAGFIALTLISPWLGLILLVAVIPSLFIQFRLSRQRTAHWNKNIETRRQLGMIEWNMFEPRNMAELRLNGMSRYLLDLRKRLRNKDERMRIDLERQYIGKRLGVQALEAGAEIVALVYTALQIIAHAQPIGQFLYVQQVVSRALNGTRGLVNEVANIDEEMANLFDYQEFMALAPMHQATLSVDDVPKEIQLTNVTFSYPSSPHPVLKDISLTIHKGDHIALVGENGAGKSTLIKIITGLYKPTTGSINLDGVPLDEYGSDSWHRYLGVLQQNYLSYGFANAKDNIYFGDVTRPFNKERFDGAVDRAQAREFLEKLPKGYENYLITWMEHADGTKGTDLSGGQWQRLALARSFYRDSPIIILDEPTSAIDALAESRIFKALFKDASKTIITISHRLSTLKKADLIYVLKDGVIVETGTHAELIARNGEYLHMFESQL